MEQLGVEEDDAIAHGGAAGGGLLPGSFTSVFSQTATISGFLQFKAGGLKDSKEKPERMSGIMAASSVYS